MLFNYQLKIGCIRTRGTTRFHTYKYKTEGKTGYELGVNIIPRKFGVLLYLWIINKEEQLREVIREKDDEIEHLMELIKVCMNWR